MAHVIHWSPKNHTVSDSIVAFLMEHALYQFTTLIILFLNDKFHTVIKLCNTCNCSKVNDTLVVCKLFCQITFYTLHALESTVSLVDIKLS